MKYVIQLICAFAGSLSFSMYLNIRGNKLLVAGCGGLLTWCIYLLLGNWIQGDVVRFFITSMLLTLYAELMARVEKAPATVFLVSAAIPLIPGGSLYETMHFAVQKQWQEFSIQGMHTLLLAGAIACGILATTTTLQIIEKIVILRMKAKELKREMKQKWLKK